MKTLRVAFFGTPVFSVPTLESLAKEFSIVAVISQSDKPTGKGGHITPSAVSTFAREHDLPLFTPNSLRSAEFQQQFKPLKIDVAVVVAYGKILPQWILDMPTYGAINIHASLLPQYRGASPIAASILHGDATTGLSYIIMNSKMDEGDIIYQTSTLIDAQETSQSLSIKLSQSASEHINMIINKYPAGELKAVPQDHSQASYCQVLTKNDGRIDFDQPPHNLERMIRAYYPWPGVWGLYKDKRVKLLPNHQIQMEGKKITTLIDFKHGYPDFPLTHF